MAVLFRRRPEPVEWPDPEAPEAQVPVAPHPSPLRILLPVLAVLVLLAGLGAARLLALDFLRPTSAKVAARQEPASLPAAPAVRASEPPTATTEVKAEPTEPAVTVETRPPVSQRDEAAGAEKPNRAVPPPAPKSQAATPAPTKSVSAGGAVTPPPAVPQPRRSVAERVTPAPASRPPAGARLPSQAPASAARKPAATAEPSASPTARPRVASPRVEAKTQPPRPPAVTNASPAAPPAAAPAPVREPAPADEPAVKGTQPEPAAAPEPNPTPRTEDAAPSLPESNPAVTDDVTPLDEPGEILPPSEPVIEETSEGSVDNPIVLVPDGPLLEPLPTTEEEAR